MIVIAHEYYVCMSKIERSRSREREIERKRERVHKREIERLRERERERETDTERQRDMRSNYKFGECASIHTRTCISRVMVFGRQR